MSPTQHRCVLPVGLRAQISPHAQTVAAQCRGRAVPAPIFPHCSSSSDTELTFCSHAALGREHSIHPLPPPPPRCPSTATSGSQLIHPPLPPPLPPPPGCTPSSRGCRWAPICIQGCAAHPAAQVPSSAPYGDGWGLRMENVASAVLGTLSGSAEGGGTPRNSELSNSRWLLCDQHGRCGSGRVGSVRGGHGSLSRDPPSRDGLEAGFSPGLWGRGCTPSHPPTPPMLFSFYAGCVLIIAALSHCIYTYIYIYSIFWGGRGGYPSSLPLFWGPLWGCPPLKKEGRKAERGEREGGKHPASLPAARWERPGRRQRPPPPLLPPPPPPPPPLSARRGRPPVAAGVGAAEADLGPRAAPRAPWCGRGAWRARPTAPLRTSRWTSSTTQPSR